MYICSLFLNTSSYPKSTIPLNGFGISLKFLPVGKNLGERKRARYTMLCECDSTKQLEGLQRVVDEGDISIYRFSFLPISLDKLFSSQSLTSMVALQSSSL